MWRHNSLQGDDDSDQSISDEEEEQDVAWSEKIVSLSETLERKKEGLGVASQLELLKGVRQKNVGFSSEDEVEIPDFQEKRSLECTHNFGGKSICLKGVGSTCEVDEQISDDEGSKKLFISVITGATVSETLDLYTIGKGKQFHPCSGSAGDRDSSRLALLDENASCSAHHPPYTEDKSPAIGCVITATAAGGRQPTQTRPASHFQSLKQGALWRSVHKGKGPDSTTDDELLDEPEAFNYLLMDKTTFEHLGGSDGEKMSETSHALPVAVIQHDHCKYSMAELLDDLDKKRGNLHLKLGRRKGRTGQRGVIKSVSSSQRAVTGDEDTCEIMSNESSMDEEEEALSLKNAVVESRRKTMADKFHEAFDFASVDNRRPPFTVPKQSKCGGSSAGLFGRLQQVMQRQKEQDMEFLKKLQSEVQPRDEGRCIDVKILSRSFDAKLTVCRCSLLENEESSLENPQQENFRKIWTIIFNSRVCGDVDLEAANLVRVHPPWKEVQVVQGGEIIILASYFSQIYA